MISAWVSFWFHYIENQGWEQFGFRGYLIRKTYVSHDEDDGMWQFLCGETHETDEAKLVSLKWVFDLDNSVRTLKDMPCGYYAERKTQDDDWIIRKR